MTFAPGVSPLRFWSYFLVPSLLYGILPLRSGASNRFIFAQPHCPRPEPSLPPLTAALGGRDNANCLGTTLLSPPFSQQSSQTEKNLFPHTNLVHVSPW